MKHKNKIKLIQAMMSEGTDGSLPEISISFRDSDSKKDAISYLIVDSQLDSEATIWDKDSEQDIALGTLSKSILVDKLTDGHHILLYNCHEMPLLGLGIFSNSISIDFRVGSEWSLKAVSSLVELLELLKSRFKAYEVQLDEEGLRFSDSERRGFNSCFQ